jgi:3-methyladenine DNA glycosylase/8-oxoguanine DNA glycosylase
VRVADGEAVSVEFSQSEGKLSARAHRLSADRLRRLTRRVFSLDTDLSSFERAARGDSGLARDLKRGRGRFLRAPELFEDAVKILLTTNCSWAATRGMVTRLIAEAGSGGAFPTAQEIARFSPAVLRARIRCGYRAHALALFARRVASGRLDLTVWEDPQLPAAALREKILQERGFGPYAAEGLLRILGRNDFFALDSWSRAKFQRLYPGAARSTDRAIARRYSRFGEFQGLALWLELTRDWS